MPREKSTKDLPKGVENILPEHAKAIYRKAHNNALNSTRTRRNAGGRHPLRRWPTGSPGQRSKRNTKRTKEPVNGGERREGDRAEVAVSLFRKGNEAKSSYCDSRLVSVSGMSSDNAGKICMFRVIASAFPLITCALTTS